ncbi:hypothetical protein D3C87_2184980 [compost metagenome]
MDRPLSAEVEAIEEELASEAFDAELVSLLPMAGIDRFFALGIHGHAVSRAA